jgi:hypothetical protein
MAPPSSGILVKEPLGRRQKRNFQRVQCGSMPKKASQRGDMKKIIWRELMQLHAIDKEKPTKEFVGRKR